MPQGYSLLYNTTSRKDIRAAEKAAERLANDRTQFLQAALGTREGRAWFYHFLADCHCWADPFTGDPYREAFAKGERNVGLRIFAEITLTAPDQYILMIREENVRIASLNAAAERSRSQDTGRDDLGPEPDATGGDTALDPYAEPDTQ